ncbi:Protein kinase domain, partial [Rhizoctonia solani]
MPLFGELMCCRPQNNYSLSVQAMNNAAFDDIGIHSRPDKRSEAEDRWVAFQPYLLSKGYQLRPRYQPDWVPSWKGTSIKPLHCEDSLDSIPIRVLDATRIQDNQQVKLKMIVAYAAGEGANEYALLKHFSESPLKDDPSNHVVPCLDSFPIPGIDAGNFVVMPLLSSYQLIPFYNLAEVHELLKQLFDGLLFLHSNNVAHRDIASTNVMMDARPLFEEPFHPFYQDHSLDAKRLIYPSYSRSEKDVRYYFIDYGYAVWFPDPNAPRTAVGVDAREAAPEQKSGQPYDPFPADVYQLGKMIHDDLFQAVDDLRFLLPLIRGMTEETPTRRLTLEQARDQMNTSFVGLHGWRYRWPLVPRNTRFQDRCWYFFRGLVAEILFLVRCIRRLGLRN